MTGYYIKDIYLYKKMISIMIVTFLFLLFFGIAFSYSYEYGNLADASYESTVSRGVTEIIFIFLSGFVIAAESFGFPLSSIEGDLSSGFVLYAYTTPDYNRRCIKTKLLELVSCLFVGIISETLYGMIFGMLFGFDNVKTGLWFGTMAISLIFFVLCIATPLTYLLKSADKAFGGILLGFILLFYSVAAVLFFTPLKDIFVKKTGRLIQDIKLLGSLEKFFEGYALVLIAIMCLIIILGMTISYFGLRKILDRGDKVCGV